MTNNIIIDSVGVLSEDFLYWVIGFSEGDGSWFIRANGTSGFEITQHSVDIALLFQIQAALNFGTVYEDKTQPKARYSVSSSDQHKLIEIFNNRIKCDYKFLQFQAWCAFLHIKYPTVPIAEIAQDNRKIDFTTGWLSGFIDAEGCFRLAIDKGDNNRPKMIFEITQKEAKPIREIAELLSLKKNIRTDRGVYVLQTSDKNARVRLINYLDKFPLKTKKRKTYELWKEAQGLDTKAPEYISRIQELKRRITDNVKNKTEK